MTLTRQVYNYTYHSNCDGTSATSVLGNVDLHWLGYHDSFGGCPRITLHEHAFRVKEQTEPENRFLRNLAFWMSLAGAIRRDWSGMVLQENIIASAMAYEIGMKPYREADKTWIFRLGRPDKRIDGPKAEKTWPGPNRKNNAGQKLKKQGRAKAEKTWPGKS